MAGIESEIRWGTGFDNALAFTYPKGLDDVRTWRRPAPGSRRTRNAAGVTDSWVNKRDFILAGRCRWFSGPYWGGNGLQDFLDWAGDGNAFRFIPDTRYPSFYIADCYLDEPFDDPAPSIEEADGSQAVDITIRQQAFDFSLVPRGLMFEYVPGKSITDPSTMAATFARGSTAYRVTRDLDLESVASGTLRDRHFESSTRAVMLEIAKTNLVVQSDALGTGWTVVGAPTITNASATKAGRPFSKVEGVDACNISREVTLDAGNGIYAYQFLVCQSGSSAGFFYAGLRDATAGAYRGRVKVTVSAAGVVTAEATTGTLLDVEPLRNGVYRIWATAPNCVAANTNRIYASDNSPDATLVDALLSGYQVESHPPTSLVPTTTATVARSADNLYFPFSHVPQEMSVYVKFTERGTYAIPSAFLVGLGAAAGSAPQLAIYLNSTLYAIQHHNGVTAVASTLGVAPTFGDTVELLATMTSGGAVTLSQSINGATATTASTSSALAFAAAWSDTRLYLNSIGTTNVGQTALQIVRVAPGVRTLAELRAA